jgi:hypothetical protein
MYLWRCKFYNAGVVTQVVGCAPGNIIPDSNSGSNPRQVVGICMYTAVLLFVT